MLTFSRASPCWKCHDFINKDLEATYTMPVVPEERVSYYMKWHFLYYKWPPSDAKHTNLPLHEKARNPCYGAWKTKEILSGWDILLRVFHGNWNVARYQIICKRRRTDQRRLKYQFYAPPSYDQFRSQRRTLGDRVFWITFKPCSSQFNCEIVACIMRECCTRGVCR